jgi:hypothetical protein
MTPLPFAAPDRSRPLLPALLPWLAHTAYWPRFDARERVRANQLMGLLVNELCLAVEHGILLVGLRQALTTPALRRHPHLRHRLARMLDDERRHTTWFAAYNHAFAPDIYGPGGMHFVAPPALVRRAAARAATLPGAWRLAAWLALATEEWSCALAAGLADSSDDGLGDREPGYRRLHGAHRRDELRHLDVDAELLAVAAHGLPLCLRRTMVTAAHAGLDQLMRPRRAGPAMLRRFATEFPRWRAELPAMTAAVVAVGARPGYWNSPGVATGFTTTAACAASWGARWDGPLEIPHG